MPQLRPQLLEEVGYQDICEQVSLEHLATADRQAFTPITPRLTLETTPPHDTAGLVRRPGDRELRQARFPESWWSRPIVTPEIYASCLHGAVCFGGRIRKISGQRHEGGQLLVANDRYLVPDSRYLRWRSRSLPHHLLEHTDQTGQYLLQDDLSQVETRPGIYYLVGSAHGHFGHFMFEGLSRLWLLERLAVPDLRFVVYEPELVDWQLAALEAAGVAPDRIVHVREPLRFERLIVPSRAYNLHDASSAEQDRLWERIGDACDDGRSPARIYCSRSRWRRHRTFVDQERVDKLFADRGFEVIHPHELDMREKIAIARSAERMAGPAGSGSCLAAFQRRGASHFIVSPHGFAYRDDHLVSHFRQSMLWYFMTDDVHDPGEVPREADYGVDIDALAGAVDQWLAQELDD